ncbi:MAG: TatD family hydrolase [Muribaculaceae bacterium]|nr:TatD family hydrolase [Muribaculaceae bacterium]
MLLNIHTHLPAPKPEAIISCNPTELPSPEDFPGQSYSVGIHPWNVGPSGLSEAELEALREAALRPDVLAIGETGIDKSRSGIAPLFAQMLAFKAHILLSEELAKPMILHCVKAHDIIISMRKEMKPEQKWIIHGFRGKPTILTQILAAGIDVSYGELFNADSVAMTPPERIFAETDESTLSINDIINRLCETNPLIDISRISENIINLF